VRIIVALKGDTMLDDHEVKEVKNFLLETMIRGYADKLNRDWFSWCVHFKYLQTARKYNPFTTSDSELKWVLSDKGKEWLDEQQKGEKHE